MTNRSSSKVLSLVSLLACLALSPFAGGQSNAPLLRLQLSNAELEMEVHRQGAGNNINDIAQTDDPRVVMRYPNTSSCVSIDEKGNFVLQKRDERDLNRPKLKSARGVLSPEDMERLKKILDSEDVQKIETPRPPDLPSDTVAIREMERLDAQINRSGNVQKFTTIKERVKTSGAGLVSSAPSNGADTYLDNGTAYKKSLSPLMKWFEEFEKKNKSGLKESKEDFCPE